MTKTETNDSMLERVAKAIYASASGAERPCFGRQPPIVKAFYFAQARAALSAMRTPTEAMVEAADEAYDNYGFFADQWDAAITAALGETP